MAVGNFFIGRVAQVGHRHVEIELFTRQRMIEIKLDNVATHLNDAGIHRMAFVIPHLEIGPRVKRDGRRKLASGDIDDGIRIYRPIPVFGDDCNIPGLILPHTLDLPLQPTNDLAVPLDELDGTGFLGAVDELPLYM